MRHYAFVGAYADYGEEPFRNLGQLSKELRNREIEFTADHGPHCLFVKMPQKGDNRDYDDLGPMTSSGILVSGAMIDLLSGFDLGATQVLELPMYEARGKPRSSSDMLEEPDYDRPVPGRWGLLHVRETKNALYDAGCEGVDFELRKHWLPEPPLMAGVPFRSNKTVLALDATIACAGPDLWREERIDDIPFISDRLRLAIEQSGLSVPNTKWLKEARLHDLFEDNG
ncbi:MAG: hypothetical protein AAFY65_14155 [Pseudomonadota bacterium]